MRITFQRDRQTDRQTDSKYSFTPTQEKCMPADVDDGCGLERHYRPVRSSGGSERRHHKNIKTSPRTVKHVRWRDDGLLGCCCQPAAVNAVCSLLRAFYNARVYRPAGRRRPDRRNSRSPNPCPNLSVLGGQYRRRRLARLRSRWNRRRLTDGGRRPLSHERKNP